MLTDHKSKIIYLIKLIFALEFFINKGWCANILGLMPVGSPSHHIWNSVIMHKIAENGHNVTILSADLPKNLKNLPKNLQYIHLEKVYSTMYNESTDESLDLNAFIGIPAHKEVPMFYDFAKINTIGVLNSDGFKQLLNYPDNFKFDLIIMDYTICDILLGFLHKFKYPPLIGISAYLVPPYSIDYVGGHIYPAYIPFPSFPRDSYMSFWSRLYNSYLYFLDNICRHYYYYPEADKFLYEHFPKGTPSVTELQKRMVLAMVNAHPSIHYPQPLPPNIIEIGGVQVQDPKPLEKDIESFINSSKKGAVFFSLGTNVKPENVGPEKTNIILNVIESLSDYNFLWKFDENFIKRKIPKNLLVKSFYPQRDILAHPKVKLFITHSGGLSTQESIWRGVPMVGIPFFVDQHRNMFQSIRAGIAVKVDILTLTESKLRSAILEVLTNKTYAENMKRVSERFRDRPMKPLDTAIWWIEYILRHPDPQHLKSPVVKLGFFISNNYDVLGFMLIVAIGILYFIIKVSNILISKMKQKNVTVANHKKYN